MNLNPEKNKKVRAVLYVIGFGGLVHLATLFVIAIVKSDRGYFHPLYTIDLDQLLTGFEDNIVVYIGGWFLFGALINIVYRLIKPRD